MRQPAKRTGGQRGVIAIMAALFASVVVIFFVVLLEYLFIVDSRHNLTNATDAWAVALGNKMLAAPVQPTFAATANTDELMTQNGVGLSPQPTLSYTKPYTLFRVMSPLDQTDSYLPLFINVSATGRPRATVLDTLVPSLLHSAVPLLVATSAARVHQVNLTTATLVRERVALLVDFSASMRLTYSGSGPSGSTAQAAAVARLAAKEIIDYYSRYYDLGLMLFGDTKSQTEITLLGKDLTKNTLESHQQAMITTASTSSTYLTDTDMVSAIEHGVAAIDGASSNLPVGTGRVILITDGQPDAGKGIDTSASLKARTDQASAASVRTMQDAWSQDNVISNVFFMQHQEGDAQMMTDAEKFMKEMAGFAKDGTPTPQAGNYLGDAGDPVKLLAYLKNIPILPYCYFDNLDRLKGQRSVDQYNLPKRGDILYGYFSESWQTNVPEYQVPRVNTFRDGELKSFIAYSQAHGAHLNADDNVPSAALQNPDNLGFYYDSAVRRVYLSPYMCAALFSPKNDNKSMRFHMRWGAPRLVDPQQPASK